MTTPADSIVSTVTLDPEVHTGSGSGVVAEMLARATRPDYEQWMRHIDGAAACTHPVRLTGQLHTIDKTTGEITKSRPTATMPDGQLYTACGNRRATVCPACAEVYRADTYQLILAGLRGGKGIPDRVAGHPAVFATFTAPSFGYVHSRREKKRTHKDQPIKVLPCRPRRRAEYCPHGVNLVCNRTHHEGEKSLGQALCAACYDYQHQVVWNLHAGELWRRTAQHVRRILDRQAAVLGVGVTVSYAKVAEFQARGVIHFHGIFRLDGNVRGYGSQVHRHRVSDRTGKPLRCAARRSLQTCPHGVALACHATHGPDDPVLGQPLCPECAEHDRTAADELVAPHACLTWRALEDAIHAAALEIGLYTPPHPTRPEGWEIAWGAEIDTRPVRIPMSGEITDDAVAAYLAKYATKATEIAGHASARLTPQTVDSYATQHTQPGRLIAAAWELGQPPADVLRAQAEWVVEQKDRLRAEGVGTRGLATALDHVGDNSPIQRWRTGYGRLRAWAHMLGYGGHFSTRSRRYSVTLRALRTARQTWRRRTWHRTADHLADDDREIVTELGYAGIGWHTTGDAALANAAAARARERRLTARDEWQEKSGIDV
jgi:hypothetical protein